MKKTIIGAAIAGSLMFSATTAMAGGVGFANVQDIFETSPLGKAKVTADEKKLKPQMDELKQNITALQDKVNSYTEEKDQVEFDEAKGDTKDAESADQQENADKQQAQVDLQKAMKEYQNLMAQVQKMASDDADAFKDALTKASAEVAKDKQLDAILPAEMSLYNVDSIDVTKEVIAKMQ
ncbi:periplasmic chaperone for outer membrane proteins Skp [Allofrancisella inopinata]|uniref:OmpH family outer membrane protein n=1 Tax=Allofrancisella inopinata TaxID=1085647 RepID=A0AAE6YJF2_9GAMM|nr:OmpH family outer membrane protein [Allofrancisella inopinata]QIV96771.1 OmpH family outer membrane protein [Allofrancisella inopinata]TDT73532.1 periplasmic chaperone for outer membrane proteins Skp [Allofrancisella inopinata]